MGAKVGAGVKVGVLVGTGDDVEVAVGVVVSVGGIFAAVGAQATSMMVKSRVDKNIFFIDVILDEVNILLMSVLRHRYNRATSIYFLNNIYFFARDINI